MILKATSTVFGKYCDLHVFHRLVAQVVATGQLQEANSLLPVSQNAATVLGPALAGLLIGPW
jgi:hypothetical protein